MNGSSRKEHLKLISHNPDVFTLDLAKRNSPPPAHDSLVAKAQRTFSSIGEAFSDTSAIALYDAKALRDVPDFCKDYLNEISADTAENFYSNICGETVLVETLSAYGRKLGLAYSEKKNILVTAGAVNAFYSLCYALCDEGDVILALSPSYILFSHSVRTFDAEMVIVPSKRKDKFSVDAQTLENSISEIKNSGRKIKAVLIVNPTNIDSQCWTQKEIEELAPVIVKHNLLVIEDRVYDGLQYDPPEDAGFFAAYEPLSARTVTIDSVSKKYGATQWRIGWMFGPEKLIDLARNAVMQSVWSPNSRYQKAAALMLLSGMDTQECQAGFSEDTRSLALVANRFSSRNSAYFSDLHAHYTLRRDLTLCLINGKDEYARRYPDLTPPSAINSSYHGVLDNAHLQDGVYGFSAPILPQAGMFILIQADQRIFEKLAGYRYPDLVFAKFLYKETKVAMLPSTELTVPEDERMFRMEFGIDIELLVQALQRIDAFTRRFLSLSQEDLCVLEKTYLSEREIYSSKIIYENTISL